MFPFINTRIEVGDIPFNNETVLFTIVLLATTGILIVVGLLVLKVFFRRVLNEKVNNSKE